MNKILTKRQSQVLEVFTNYWNKNFSSPSIRVLASLLNIKSPNGMKRHLDALVNKQYLIQKKGKYYFKKQILQYMQLPVLGYANAGQPIAFAEESNLGSIKVKKDKYPQNTFAVIVSGDSMNKQIINKKRLLDNHYAIVQKTSHFNSGDVVLAIIDDTATIKNITKNNNLVILYPNSTNKIHREIYIEKSTNFFINGKVIDILPIIIN